MRQGICSNIVHRFTQISQIIAIHLCNTLRVLFRRISTLFFAAQSKRRQKKITHLGNDSVPRIDYNRPGL
jgi:hypothetical protein